MIYPHLPVEVWKKTGSTRYAEPIFTRFTDERCAPVRLVFTIANTTVRTDAAASKAMAKEYTADVVILVRTSSKIGLGDKIVIRGHPLRVVGIQPRYTVAGVHDHDEISAAAWSDEVAR